MSKTQSKRKAAGPRTEDSAGRLSQIADAKQAFLDSALNMSWQLAVTIIVPVIIGVQLDNHFHSSPEWTLGMLFLAVFMACGVVVKTLKGDKVKQFSNNSKRKTSAK